MYSIDNEKLKSGDYAVVTDIEKFALHDGPGIRTMVFFKGCPLRCLWCQNPETWSTKPEWMYFQDNCIGCGQCVSNCVQGAITITEDGLRRDSYKCTGCGACAKGCYAEAIKVTGQLMSIDEIIDKVIEDKVFYETSGGGLTLSGGECTMQPAFATKLLSRAQEEEIHTAIETCGFCQWETFKEIIEHVDLLLFDIKVPISERSKKYTGQDCMQIMENIKGARALGKKVILRFPMIPNVNDDDESLRIIGELGREAKVEQLHILPFHQIGSNKWHALQRNYAFEEWRVPTDDEVEHARKFLSHYIPHVSAGGNEYDISTEVEVAQGEADNNDHLSCDTYDGIANEIIHNVNHQYADDELQV